MPISSKLPLKKTTQCIILVLFLLFSQIKMGDIDSIPPPSHIGVKHPNKTKVKT